jgi:hypothetical protein
MVLTRDFKKTIMERVARDEQYRKGLLTEAVNKLLEGNLNVGKAMLRDYNNATITFPTLAQKLNKSSNSIRRMLGPVLHDLQQDGDLPGSCPDKRKQRSVPT